MSSFIGSWLNDVGNVPPSYVIEQKQIEIDIKDKSDRTDESETRPSFEAYVFVTQQR